MRKERDVIIIIIIIVIIIIILEVDKIFSTCLCFPSGVLL